MKLLSITLSVFIVSLCFITACETDTTIGEVVLRDPEINYLPRAAATTGYTFAHASIAESCASGGATHCAAVIHQSQDKVGIAVKDRHSSGNGDFDFKMYFTGTAIPASYSGTGEFKIRKGSTLHSAAASVNVTITAAGTLHTITFNAPVTVGSLTINNGDVISAQLY